MNGEEGRGLAFDDREALSVLDALSKQGDCRANLDEVVHGLMLAFGGGVGFARQVKLDFDENPAGSANRIKIEMQILGLLQNFVPKDEEYEESDYAAMASKIEQANAGS